MGISERQVAVITGAGQGIGRTMAVQFARAGWHVVVADRNGDGAASVAAEIGAEGLAASAVQVDVADEASTQAMADTVRARLGRVDALVNNAAIFSTISMKPFEEISIAEWRQVIDVNITGVFLCTRAVTPLMRKREYGRIVNMSSATVLFGRQNYLHYVTSKSALVGMTRSLARELGGAGITVNAIMPGSVETEVSRDSVTPEQAARIVAGQSVPRRLTPDDVVTTALFLSGRDAGAITGQTVVVDGGANFL